jgi:monovalent cation:H+ antiporter-2, CPA2 family
MDHAVPLISTLAAAFGLALIFGFVAARLKLPALIGYLVAGIVIGPATPGFVADIKIASQLAEVGVMLLMFGVGLHLSFADLLSVRKIALPGAIVQMVVVSALTTWIATYWGWPLMGAIVFGLSLSVASTVVLFKALERKKLLESVNGRIAIGWLVVQDLAMVLGLVLLPALADLVSKEGRTSSATLWLALGTTLVEVAVWPARCSLVKANWRDP